MRISILLLLVLVACSAAQRSCKDVRGWNPQAQSGVYTLRQTLSNGNFIRYDVFCHWIGANEGWVYMSPTAVRDVALDLSKHQDVHHEVNVLIRFNSGETRASHIRQLPQYCRVPMVVLQSGFASYAPISNINLGPYLYLGQLPASLVGRRKTTFGWESNAQTLTWTNCDANINSYWAFFPNLKNATVVHYNHGNSDTSLTRGWRATAVATDVRLPNEYYMVTEMHFGGCGGYVTSNKWDDANGSALGMKFEGCSRPHTPDGALMQDAGFHLDDTLTFRCQTGYVMKSGSTTRTCQRFNTWSGVPIVCSREY